MSKFFLELERRKRKENLNSFVALSVNGTAPLRYAVPSDPATKRGIILIEPCVRNFKTVVLTLGACSLVAAFSRITKGTLDTFNRRWLKSARSGDFSAALGLRAARHSKTHPGGILAFVCAFGAMIANMRKTCFASMAITAVVLAGCGPSVDTSGSIEPRQKQVSAKEPAKKVQASQIERIEQQPIAPQYGNESVTAQQQPQEQQAEQTPPADPLIIGRYKYSRAYTQDELKTIAETNAASMAWNLSPEIEVPVGMAPQLEVEREITSSKGRRTDYAIKNRLQYERRKAKWDIPREKIEITTDKDGYLWCSVTIQFEVLRGAPSADGTPPRAAPDKVVWFYQADPAKTHGEFCWWIQQGQ